MLGVRLINRAGWPDHWWVSELYNTLHPAIYQSIVAVFNSRNTQSLFVRVIRMGVWLSVLIHSTFAQFHYIPYTVMILVVIITPSQARLAVIFHFCTLFHLFKLSRSTFELFKIKLCGISWFKTLKNALKFFNFCLISDSLMHLYQTFFPIRFAVFFVFCWCAAIVEFEV